MCNKAMNRRVLKLSVEHKRLSSSSCEMMNGNRLLANENGDKEVRRSENH